MKIRRIKDEAAVGLGAMILFISTGILACLILATMIQMVEVTAQTPEKIAELSTREIADKIIVHEIYVWDDFDNYGIIWELAPGSSFKDPTELYWLLQCTDDQDKYWAFWGDFQYIPGQPWNSGLQGPAHEFTPKLQDNQGLKAEWYDNQGAANTVLPDLANRIPDLITVQNQISWSSSGGSWGLSSGGNLPWADEYSLRASGYIDVPADGTYTFEIESDDGSRLWVDGTLIADNDGHHGMTTVSGNIELEAGLNSINLEYFENLGGAGLILRWENNVGLGSQIVPAASLFHDSNMIDEDGDRTALGANVQEDWILVNRFEPGVLYEVNIDQNNGLSGSNYPKNTNVIPHTNNEAGIGDACGPRQLNEHDLEAELTLIVANGGSTWNHFKVIDSTAGSRIA